jgi:GNAT superfamily N-acetyltransferase
MTTGTTITLQTGLPPDQTPRAAALYWQAFGGKLGPLLRPDAKAVAFLASVMNPRFALCALDDDGTLLGLAGIKTAEGGLVGGGFDDLARHYGWLGAAWRAPLLALFERDPEPDILQMEGLCVSEQARGQGLGTALLTAIKDHARERGDRAVRLDVIDTNPRAEALYRREGFEPRTRETLGPMRWLFGFSSALRMEAPLR